jgi:hypothetical protein
MRKDVSTLSPPVMFLCDFEACATLTVMGNKGSLIVRIDYQGE